MRAEGHLSEVEFHEVLMGCESVAARAHLAICRECAVEHAALAAMRAELKRDLSAQAEQPGYFWSRQQARIRERIHRAGHPLRLAMAGILALVAVAFSLVAYDARPKAPPAAQTQANDPDDLLLRNIQTSLRREVPRPLMPATVIVDEVAAGSVAERQVKEN